MIGRQRARWLVWLVSAAMLASGCSGGASPEETGTAEPTGAATEGTGGSSYEGATLTVGVWGGVWEEAMNEVIPDFEEQTGATVTLDISSSTDRVAKLQAAAGGAAMDIAFLTPEAMAVANENDLMADLTTDDLPAAANLTETLASNFQEGDSFYAVPVSWGATAILWREDLVPFEITKFTDLWRPELEGKITIQNMPTLGAASFLIQAAHAHGGSQENLEPGWAAMQELQPNIQQFYSVSSDSLASLVSGDVWAVTTFAGQGLALESEGVEVTFPEEGTAYSIQTAGVPASASEPELAAEFLDYLLSPEIQTEWARTTQAAPASAQVELPADVQENIAETPEVVNNLLDLDFRDMGLNMQDWAERWQREVAG